MKACRSDSGEPAENFVHIEEPVPVAARERTEHQIRTLNYVYVHIERLEGCDPWENESAVLKSVGNAVEILFGEIGRITLAVDVIRLEKRHAFLQVPLEFAVALRCALVTCADSFVLHRMTSNAHTLCVNSERYVHK